MLVRVDAPRPSGRQRGRGRRSRRRWRRGLAAVAVALLLPIPWQHVADDLGVAWGIDNRLLVEGERLDPPGRYSWLTVGRPPLVGELLWHELASIGDREVEPVARDMRRGPRNSRPVAVEPLAAAVGQAVADGQGLGDTELAPIDAVLGGHSAPYSWIRSLSTGSSHGLMIGLVAYVAASDDDLAGGRHLAGTGSLAADGTVGRIGGLAGKVGGARRAGVDVLLIPAGQETELDGVDVGDMIVLSVATIEDAIAQLHVLRADNWS